MVLPRRLALVTAPRPGEAFGSWTDRMAWLNRCSPGVMADLLGLELRGSSPEVRPRVFGVLADEGLRHAVCAATGVAGGAVDRMHLAVFDPGPLSAAAALAVGETAARASAGREWVEVSGSRACPRCLLASGGVWQLWWKLSCAGVCPVHGVVLLDRCPSCGCVLRWGGKRPRVLPVAWSRPPTVCASSIGGRPCPQWLPLSRVRPAAASVGEFQRRWLEIAYGRVRPAVGGVEVSAAEWFAAFRGVRDAAEARPAGSSGPSTRPAWLVWAGAAGGAGGARALRKAVRLGPCFGFGSCGVPHGRDAVAGGG
ncbi:TniQ family protein [Streptomyces sp. NPDC058728]